MRSFVGGWWFRREGNLIGIGINLSVRPQWNVSFEKEFLREDLFSAGLESHLISLLLGLALLTERVSHGEGILMRVYNMNIDIINP